MGSQTLAVLPGFQLKPRFLNVLIRVPRQVHPRGKNKPDHWNKTRADNKNVRISGNNSLKEKLDV